MKCVNGLHAFVDREDRYAIILYEPGSALEGRGALFSILDEDICEEGYSEWHIRDVRENDVSGKPVVSVSRFDGPMHNTVLSPALPGRITLPLTLWAVVKNSRIPLTPSTIKWRRGVLNKGNALEVYLCGKKELYAHWKCK